MSKLEKYLDELLIFMADEIEKNAGTTKTIEFNFSFEFIEKYFNADDERFEDGKDLKALELPGLWNGAMSDWNTVFVEVPLETFNPVKTVNDLLRDQHQ